MVIPASKLKFYPIVRALGVEAPDGQVKLLHLWPPKLLHLIWARRVDYELISEAVAIREAASLSR